MVIRTWLPIINSKNLLCYFYLYVWHECSCVGIVCACRGQRSIWGIIVYCSLPETCWLAWLTGLWGCRCTLPCPASRLTRGVIVLSVDAFILQAGPLGRIKENEEGGGTGPASLRFGLQLGEESPLPHSLTTMMFWMVQASWTEPSEDPSPDTPFLSSVVTIWSLGSELRKQTLCGSIWGT